MVKLAVLRECRLRTPWTGIRRVYPHSETGRVVPPESGYVPWKSTGFWVAITRKGAEQHVRLAFN